MTTLEATKRQILLVKLMDLYENAPPFVEGIIAAKSPQRRWLGEVGAIMKALGIAHSVEHSSTVGMISSYPVWAGQKVVGHVGDAIEELKLELELDGRSEIGTVYRSGQVYDFFRDLRKIISRTEKNLLVVDPYLNGDAFDDYLSDLPPNVTARVLCDRYTDEVKGHVEKYGIQHGEARVELRDSRRLHDRVIAVDNSEVWIVGHSIKDAASKGPTYLIPLAPSLAATKLAVYEDIWTAARNV